MSTPNPTLTPEDVAKVARQLGWKFPLFLPMLPEFKFMVDPNAGTAYVTDAGEIAVDPKFWSTLDADERMGVVAHEFMHPTMLHAQRKGARNHRRWNRAADRAINNALRTAGIKLPNGALYGNSGQENWTAEEFYETEPEEPGDNAPGGGNPAPGAGCGEVPSPNGSPAKSTRKWKEVAAQAKAMQRSCGTGSGDALIGLLEPPPSKVAWSQVLRQVASIAASAHGKDDQTWHRRSRRSTTQVVLPGWRAATAKVAVVIDSSGSMGPAEIETACAEVLSVLKATSTRAYLVVHDDGVSYKGWLSERAKASDVAARIQRTGGTSFDEAYAAVAAAGRFDAMVHLTDGEVGRWPALPANARKSFVALIGDSAYGRQAVPAGAVVVEVETPRPAAA